MSSLYFEFETRLALALQNIYACVSISRILKCRCVSSPLNNGVKNNEKGSSIEALDMLSFQSALFLIGIPRIVKQKVIELFD